MKERHGEQKLAKTQVAGADFDILPYDGSAKYLGRLVSFSDYRDVEIENRIKVAWKKFFAMKDVLCNASYPLMKRVRLFDATITPTVLYGAGTWTMTSGIEAQLRKTQRRMLRSIYQRGRRRQRCIDSSTRTDNSSDGSEHLEIASEDPEENMEPWHEWVQRVTHEIEESMGKLRLEDWITAQRRRKYRWAGHVARREDSRWSTLLLD